MSEIIKVNCLISNISFLKKGKFSPSNWTVYKAMVLNLLVLLVGSWAGLSPAHQGQAMEIRTSMHWDWAPDAQHCPPSCNWALGAWCFPILCTRIEPQKMTPFPPNQISPQGPGTAPSHFYMLGLDPGGLESPPPHLN